MVLEFYVEGPDAPAAYDLLLKADGRHDYRDGEKRTRGVFRVVVQLRHRRVSVYLANAMFRIIRQHQIVTVAFYGFPE